MDSLSPEHRSWNMSRIRGTNTKPELQLRSLLHRAGYRFRLQDKRLPGRPDIVLPKYRAAIFVHGCFWHRHEGCPKTTTPSTRREFWQEKFRRTVERDRQKAAEIEASGWDVITVWECELETSPETVLRDVTRQLSGGNC